MHFSLELNVNSTLESVAHWLSCNGLALNFSKTKALVFNNSRNNDDFNICINGSVVELVNEMKCLGVVIDSNFDFHGHVNLLLSRVMFQLRRLYCLDSYLPCYVRQRVASSLLMSHINYCLEVISGTTAEYLCRIEKIFNSIIRYVYGLRRYDHISAYAVRFLGLPFKKYVNLRLLLCFYRIITSNGSPSLCSYFSFCRSSRNPQLLLPRFFSMVYERSFVVRVCRLWNRLPLNLRNFSYPAQVFRNKCLEHFLGSS